MTRNRIFNLFFWLVPGFNTTIKKISNRTYLPITFIEISYNELVILKR